MKKLALIVCALALVAVSAVPALAGIKEDWAAARQAVDQRDFQTAVNLASKLIQYGQLDRPSLAKVHTLRGFAMKKMGNKKAALSDFYKSISYDPNYYPGYFQRGMIWGEQGKWDYALWDFSKVIQLNPRHSDSYWNRATAFQMKGDFARAVADQQMYCQLQPNDQKGRSRLAMLRNKAGSGGGGGGGYQQPAGGGGGGGYQQPGGGGGGGGYQQPVGGGGGGGGFRMNSSGLDWAADKFGLKEKAKK